MSTDTPSTPAERPGRYSRTSAGLVVSLVVTVLAIGALYWFTGLFRNTPEYKPENVDYLGSIAAAQSAGIIPIYPAELPPDWTATGVDLDPAAKDTVGIRLLTDDGKFVGIQQAKTSGTGLVQEWVDEDAVAADDYVPAKDVGAIAPQWAGYTDDGGDTGYVADVGKVTVLVYGSAPAEDLQEVIDSLTKDRLRR